MRFVVLLPSNRHPLKHPKKSVALVRTASDNDLDKAVIRVIPSVRQRSTRGHCGTDSHRCGNVATFLPPFAWASVACTGLHDLWIWPS
jgi:hypothetical protein